MKCILAGLLTLITFATFSQQWIDYQIDSTVSVTIPDNYKVVDTLGQRFITAQVDNGMILISVASNVGNNAMYIDDEINLLEAYKGFQKGFIESQKGKLINSEMIEQGGLKTTRFSFSATIGNENQIRTCTALIVNKKTYSISFWELEATFTEMTSVRERVLSAFHFSPGLTFENQLGGPVEGSRAYKMGYFIGYAGSAILFAGLVFFIIRWASRR